MEIIKPYKKEKEGKLQRLPVTYLNSYHIDTKEQHLIDIKPKTKVYVRGSEPHVESLDPNCGVKRARMVTNPFIAKMRENAAKND